MKIIQVIVNKYFLKELQGFVLKPNLVQPRSSGAYLPTPPPRLRSCMEEDRRAATPRPAAAMPAISNGPLSEEDPPT